MTGFSFDQPPSPGTNRHAASTDCATCDGHRMVRVGENPDGTEIYGRCPACNAVALHDRAPVAEDAWWKQ